jgi:hypothetical protein
VGREVEEKRVLGRKEKGRKVKQDGSKRNRCISAAWKARRYNCVKVQAREEKKERGGTVQTGTTRARRTTTKEPTYLT